MANRIRYGAHSAEVAERHGRAGQIQFKVDIDPALKDGLIEIALDKELPLKEVVADAFQSYIDSQEEEPCTV